MAFLRNHKDDIAAMDLFTVPTASFRLPYGLFVIEHGRRHIVHFNATFNPTASWVMQQLREAFPYDTAPRYLIFDGDAIFSPAVVEFIRAMGTKPIRTSYRSPWQNGTAERWIGSCRRELLEHVVVLGDVLRSLSKKNDVWFSELKPVPGMGTDKENHTSWERYYQVSDCSSSSRNDWYSGR
jgi:transposase InsO family protein